MTDLLSPAQVERLPVGSILFPAEHGKPRGSALIVIPGRLLTPIAELPERAGGEEPGGEPIPAWGIKEFFLIQKGKGRLPTGPTADRHALAWYQKMQRERRVRSHEEPMSDLRKQLIRLAHENPGKVREAILPLLKRSALSDARIKALSRGPGVKTIAVENFLGTLEGMTERDALLNLDQDARSYRWNAATKKAIRTGIREHYR